MGRIDWQKINVLIDETPFISEKRREFYRRILAARYEKILKHAFDTLTL